MAVKRTRTIETPKKDQGIESDDSIVEVPEVIETELDFPEEPKLIVVPDVSADLAKAEKEEVDRLKREKTNLDSAEAAKDKDYEAAYALLIKLGFTSAMIDAFWGNVSVEERKGNRGKGNGVSAKVLRVN